MKLLGHRTPAIFQRYAITTESDLHDGVARLAAAQVKQTAKPKRGRVVTMPKRARSKQTA
jgi:hypothetical protein